ncbi:hypothetical protein KC19_12G174400 [Ceratodon purpureus]|uniref:Uncharacterized protein n=1 Tax=Ceratodon purpureus TaxID=3225 RepID=A0A8T0GE74_CERPU|nr:hypothetical protein KC19_12G174400 [Ceratodon purpureus]
MQPNQTMKTSSTPTLTTKHPQALPPSCKSPNPLPPALSPFQTRNYSKMQILENETRTQPIENIPAPLETQTTETKCKKKPPCPVRQREGQRIPAHTQNP